MSPGTNGVANTPFAAVDPVRVVDHLTVLLEAALGATRAELEAPGSLLSKTRYSDTLQRCSRFALDTQVALYIQKDLIPTDSLENGAADDCMTAFRPFHPLVQMMLICM
jgi:dynein heavy chain 1